MAQQTMGQTYVGDAFGNKWNRAWSTRWRLMAGSLFDLNVDDIPQPAFDALLSIVFYAVVDDEYNGKVPNRVKGICTVPERTERNLADVLQEARGA